MMEFVLVRVEIFYHRFVFVELMLVREEVVGQTVQVDE